MKVIRIDNALDGNSATYETDVTDIREIARIYGHTEDTLELYDDTGELVAMATWFFGHKQYNYCTGKTLHGYPRHRIWRE